MTEKSNDQQQDALSDVCDALKPLRKLHASARDIDKVSRKLPPNQWFRRDAANSLLKMSLDLVNEAKDELERIQRGAQ